MQALTDHIRVDQLAYRFKQGVIALHQIGNAEQIAGTGQVEQLIGLGQAQRQRLFADHMLTRIKGGSHLGVMEEGRRGDVNKINLIKLDQVLHLHIFGQTEAAGNR